MPWSPRLPSHRRSHRPSWLALPAIALSLLSGCAPQGPAWVTHPQHAAQAQDSRVQFIVLHFTSESLAESLRLLTGPAVSAHYLVSDGSPPVVYRLVDEQRRAWHAGPSAWQGHSPLNAASIGIEIVNPGPVTGADGQVRYAPYPPAQIDTVIALLRSIQARHGVRPDRIVGHSDIAPLRKQDPGPAFPWHRLGEAGLVPWPQAGAVQALRQQHDQQPKDVAWVQTQLARIGFEVPRHGGLDSATQQVLAAFQMRYRPARHDGQPDAETTAWLAAVVAANAQALAATVPDPAATR